MNKDVADIARDILELPKCYSDEVVLESIKGTLLEARVELHLVLIPFKKAFKKEIELAISKISKAFGTHIGERARSELEYAIAGGGESNSNVFEIVCGDLDFDEPLLINKEPPHYRDLEYRHKKKRFQNV